MTRRGDVLRTHILDTAKVLFVEHGFAGTSMDLIAASAATSKRSLYAYFPSKEMLLTAAIERMRELFDERILTPADYHEDAVEAVALFCTRLQRLIRWSSVALTLRVGVAEAARFPVVARGLHDALFATAVDALAEFCVRTSSVAADDAVALARRLVGVSAGLLLADVLLGLEPLTAQLGPLPASDDADVAQTRRSLQGVLP